MSAPTPDRSPRPCSPLDAPGTQQGGQTGEEGLAKRLMTSFPCKQLQWPHLSSASLVNVTASLQAAGNAG